MPAIVRTLDFASVFRVYEKETFDYNVILRGETPTGFVRPCDAHLPEAWDGATKLHVTLVGLRAPGDAFYLGLTVDTKQVGVPSGYPLGEFLRRCWTALHTFAFSVPATQAAHGVGDVDDAVAMGGGGAGSAGVGASASSSSSAAATRGGGGGGGAASASALSPPLSSNHSAGGAFGRPFEFTSTYSGTGSSGKKKDLFISLSLDLTEGTAAEGRAPLLTVRNTRDESGVTVYYLKSQCSKLVRSPPGGAAAALPSATGGGAGGEGAGPLRSDVEELYAAYGLSCPRLGRKPYENADGATRAAAALLRWEAEELAAEQRRNCGEIDRQVIVMRPASVLFRLSTGGDTTPSSHFLTRPSLSVFLRGAGSRRMRVAMWRTRGWRRKPRPRRRRLSSFGPLSC